MEVPRNQRYKLSLFKELNGPLIVPNIGETVLMHLDQDYCEKDPFYSFRIDRPNEDEISFMLIRDFDWILGNIYEEV